MDSKPTSQNNALLKRTKIRGWLLLGFLIVFSLFCVRLAKTESPAEWEEADVTVVDIKHASLKPNCWQITDTEGNIYTAYESDAVMEQILPKSTYHIVYSPHNRNGIRAINYGDTIIVDYAHSVAAYSERNISDWLLTFLSLTGSVVTIVCMVVDVRKKISTGNLPQ